MKLTTIKSARESATLVHLGQNTGWSARPFCGALKTGRRSCDATKYAHGTVNCRGCIAEANKLYLDFEVWVHISDRVRNLIAAVRAHAEANYNTGAWDIIVEAYADSELAQVVGKCRTAAGAVRKVAAVVAMYAERRAPHDAEIAAATEPTEPQPVAEYDRHADGPHPDGSVVRWRHDPESGDSWARRTWPGKVGESSIEYRDFETGSELVEVYTPGWRGVNLASDNYCPHSAPEGEICWDSLCRRPACCPF